MARRSLKERFFGWLFKLSGWKHVGSFPKHLKKYVIIVAPHTSNWDFFVGYGYKHLAGFHPNFLGKRELFKIPIVGWFLRSIGGYPVDRSKASNLVDQVVELFKQNENFVMTITPEGTRSYAPKWKSGFYRIAHQANVPIVRVAFDYPSKTIYVEEPMMLRGEMEQEIEEIKEYYRQFTGKHAEKGVK